MRLRFRCCCPVRCQAGRPSHLREHFQHLFLGPPLQPPTGEAQESVFLTNVLAIVSGYKDGAFSQVGQLITSYLKSGSGQRVVKSILTPSPSWRQLVLLETHMIPALGPPVARLPEPFLTCQLLSDVGAQPAQPFPPAQFPSHSSSHGFLLHVVWLRPQQGSEHPALYQQPLRLSFTEQEMPSSLLGSFLPCALVFQETWCF